jgi:hypothetical protein
MGEEGTTTKGYRVSVMVMKMNWMHNFASVVCTMVVQLLEYSKIAHFKSGFYGT